MNHERPDPACSWRKYGLEAVHPDTFAVQQFDLNEARIVAAARSHRQSLKNPPRDAEEYLETLSANGLVITADRLSEFREAI